MIKSVFQKYLLYFISFVLGGFLVWYFMGASIFEQKKAESSTIVLEKMKKVTKLISVEGYFSEIYDYKESYKYDFFNLFSKKVLLRVTAKVSVGYDFDKVNISIDSLTKTITLNELPKAEILSIDHDLDYYDISEGSFNSFTREEYNMINKNAKALIASKGNTTQLLEKAEQEKQDYLNMMDIALKSVGWKFIIKNSNFLN